MTDKIDAAQALARRGFCVFPLAINGKTPALDGNWQRLATTDPKRIDQLWRCPVFDSPIDYNIGIAIGADTVVVDVDVRDGKPGAKSLALWEAINDPLPSTYEVTTASGGRHLYFKSEKSGSFPARLAEGIDLKDHGDYVVGPGSEIDGSSYDLATTGPVSACVLLDSVATDTPRPRARLGAGAATLVNPDAQSAVARAAEYLKTGPESGTFKVACRVKDFGISREKCLELMLEHWPPADAKGEEHVSFRVDNAYSYGQNSVGSASPEAEFDAVEIDVGIPTAKRRGLYVLDWDKAVPALDRPFLIEDIVDAGAMIVTYGDSNAGKTYVVLDMAFHIASGKPWIGYATQPGLVIYVAAEGGTGFTRRIEAFRRHYSAPSVPFGLIPCPIDLQSDQADTGKLIRLIRETEERLGHKCVMIVVDTLARAMAGGDENTAMDMGKFIGHCDRLRAATGAAVNVIHHTGKDKSKGARGSSALRAATDTEIEIVPGLLTVAKQRDMAPVNPRRFALKTVDVGTRANGKTVSACVVEWPLESEFEGRVSEQAREFLRVLERLVSEKLDAIGDDEEADKADIGIVWNVWEKAAKSCLNGARGKSIARSVLFRLRLELSQSKLVEQNKRNQWVICDLSQQSQ